MVITSPSWLIILIASGVAIAGIVLFAALVRRRVFPLVFALALAVPLAAMVWLTVARSGRLVDLPSRVIAPFRAPYERPMPSPRTAADAECEGRIAESTGRRAEVTESFAEEMRRAETLALDAEASLRAHRVVITDEGPSVVVLPEPPPPHVLLDLSEGAKVEMVYPPLAAGRWYKHRGIRRGGLVWNIVTAFSIAALLFVGYVFLDAGTRGQFTWSLRILSVMVLAGICLAMAALRVGL